MTAKGPAKNLLVDVWLVSGLSRALVEGVLRGSGLTPDEFAVYGLVVDLAPVTAADLTRVTGIPTTTMASLIARCESRGDLERHQDPDDRRHRPLRLTPAGAARYQAPLTAFANLLASLGQQLDLPIDDVRFHLQSLDGALRRLSRTPPRPYTVEAPRAERRLDYEGESLSGAQQREVRAFIDWVRHRDHRDQPPGGRRSGGAVQG